MQGARERRAGAMTTSATRPRPKSTARKVVRGGGSRTRSAFSLQLTVLGSEGACGLSLLSVASRGPLSPPIATNARACRIFRSAPETGILWDGHLFPLIVLNIHL